MKRVAIINNYDSFVYNVAHLVKRATGISPDIFFNDKIPFESLYKYTHIILSPGPGTPNQANDLIKVIDYIKFTHHILGICLGHQAIVNYFGGSLVNLEQPLHGHKSPLFLKDKNDPVIGKLFSSQSKKRVINVALYHSWAADYNTLPNCLSVGTVNEKGIIMSLYHKELPIYGVQFHPESVASDYGVEIISNWLQL